MSKPTGIEAAVAECFRAAAPPWLPDADEFREIIARHCLGKDDFIISDMREERTKLLAACKEYREKLDRSELEVKRLARIAGFNSPIMSQPNPLDPRVELLRKAIHPLITRSNKIKRRLRNPMAGMTLGFRDIDRLTYAYNKTKPS